MPDKPDKDDEKKQADKPTVTVNIPAGGWTLTATANPNTPLYFESPPTITANTSCYPDSYIRVGDRLDLMCHQCGHPNWLHSTHRACVGCEMIRLVLQSVQQAENERRGK